jgi:hypothetical protein
MPELSKRRKTKNVEAAGYFKVICR